MKNNVARKLMMMGFAAILPATGAMAQEHRWAGRTLDEFEWSIHERLSALPFHGVFDTLRFETRGGTVILSGQVVKPSVREYAARAVRRVAGVQNVINHIEVLPNSRHDDTLRKKLYRAIYEEQPAAEVLSEDPHVHIIVKNGWASLEGVVGSDDERRTVHLRALRVTSNVTDNLRVAVVGL